MQAAEALGALAVQEAAPGLLETLNDSDRYVRLYAAQALVRLGETEGLTVLHGALEHPSSLFLRLYAAEVLADLQDGTPRAWLSRVVADPTMAKRDRLYAAWILGRLGDPSGIRHVEGLLQDSDPYVRLQTAWTLGEIGNPEASPVLRSALLDPERAVRIHAAWALKRLLLERPTLRG
jgi:HEAT repeat protein